MGFGKNLGDHSNFTEARWPHESLQLNPRAIRRVYFMDPMDPTNQMQALFNPSELPFSTEAVIGELGPIGWSHDIQQYARTKSTGFSLTLEYSSVAFVELGVDFPEMNQAHGFFRSFLYGASPGIAPKHLMMIWPNTAAIICTVKKVAVRFTRWDWRLNVRAFTVQLDLMEDRRSFLGSGEVSQFSFTAPDYALQSRAAVVARTGTPTRVTNSAAKIDLNFGQASIQDISDRSGWTISYGKGRVY